MSEANESAAAAAAGEGAGEREERVLVTPLHAQHVQLGARFRAFGPAEVVADYGVAVDEPLPLDHPLMVDLSFQGAIRVFGVGAQRFLQAMLSADIQKLDRVGSSCYALMLTSEAYIIDVAYVVRTGEDEFMLVVDAPVVDECMEWMDNNSRIAMKGERVFPDVEVADQTGQLATIALMGPGTVQLLQELAGFRGAGAGAAGVDADDAAGAIEMARDLEAGFHFDDRIANMPMMMLSDFEVEGSVLVYCPRQVAAPLWEALLGFEELQVVGLDQYVSIRRAHRTWLDSVEDGKYQTPQQAGLEHLLRESGGYVGARAL